MANKMIFRTRMFHELEQKTDSDIKEIFSLRENQKVLEDKVVELDELQPFLNNMHRTFIEDSDIEVIVELNPKTKSVKVTKFIEQASYHFEYIQKLIKNFDGYIFCEKPPVTSLNELKDLENIPDKKKLKIFFNFNFRFSELSDNFKKQINSKNIGSIIHIDIISSHGLAFKNHYPNSWRADGKKNLHNILDTVAIHYLDLLNFHLEEFDKSFYFPSLISGNGTSFDTCYLVLKYSNGMTVSILNSYATPSIDEILIVGTEGFFSIRNNLLEVHSPRDTFDSRGFFIPPPISYKKNFLTQNDYNDSLKKSLNFFISHVFENKDFDIQHFNKSLSTNKLILDLKNS